MREPAGLLPDLDQVGALAEQLKEPLAQSGRRRALEQAAAAARQREAHFGIAERHLRDEPRNLRRFGGVGLQELASRRQVVEEVRDFDRRALRRAGLALGRDGSAVDPDLGAGRAPARAGAQREVRDRRDARAALRHETRACESRARSSAPAILLVACRSIASRASSGSMPSPSSSTRSDFLPPSSMATAIRRAPASSAFSTSSLTTDAGRSTTSPAAIWFARWSGRRWMRGMGQSAVGVVSHRLVGGEAIL